MDKIQATGNRNKVLTGGMIDVAQDGSVLQGVYAPAVMVRDEAERDALPSDYPPGTIAFTPGEAQKWQKTQDGAWADYVGGSGSSGSAQDAAQSAQDAAQSAQDAAQSAQEAAQSAQEAAQHTTEHISDWLDNHPEATTTVQDGSITRAKLDADLQQKTDEVSELKSALPDVDNATNMTFNHAGNMVDYGYNAILDLAPSGGTGASAIGVKQRGNLFTLNTTSSPSKAVRIKLNNGVQRTYDSDLMDSWPGITLKTGHTYRVSCVHVSGTSTQDVPNAISVYETGSHSTIGISKVDDEIYARTFRYNGTPVNLAWSISAGATFSNYTAYVILEDLTENVAYNLHEDEARFNTAANLVNYGYDTDSVLVADSSASSSSVTRLTVIRHKTNILLNGGNVNTRMFVNISGSITRTANTSTIDGWNGITLTPNKRYRVILEKISGTASDEVTISVYKAGTHNTLGKSTKLQNPYRFIREFTCPDANVNLVLWIPAGTTFDWAEYSVVLQELTLEDSLIGPVAYYNGESVNVNRAITCEKYMTISTESSNGRQGATVYGKYLFVAYNKLPMISVYDFETRAHVGNILFTPVDTYHCNNINFGNEKYDAADAFPLLYVSQEDADEHKCLVFRITESEGVFSATLAQTITYPAPADAGMYYPNCFIDTINSLIYLEGYTQSSYSAGETRKLRITGYDLPKLAAGDITLDTANAIQTFTVNALPTSCQGGFVIGDKIMQIFGNPNRAVEIYLGQISLSSERWVTQAILNGIGITEEPESVFLYDGHLYVFMQNRDIYKLYSD